MARLLITGGAGFQGRFLVKHFLNKGHKITVLNTFSQRAVWALSEFKDKVSVVWGSVTDKELVYKTVRGHDCVFHLAARIHVDESIEDPLATINVNFFGTYNILESVRHYKIRLIYTSSCEVYGAPLNNLPIGECAELRPHSPYAASKVTADRLCFSYFKTYNVDVAIVRPFNVFGPFQKKGSGGAVIPIFVDFAIRKKPLIVYGDGNQKRDYMYVDDLVRAYDLVYNHEELRGQTINFGTGKVTKIIDIAKYIAKKFKGKIIYGRARPGEVLLFKADITKAKKLGFKPTVNIWEGINKYIDWFREQSQR